METRYFYILRYALAASDIILVNLCFFIGMHLSNRFGITPDLNAYKSTIIICNLIWLVCTGVYGLYAARTIHNLENIYKATWRSTALHLALFTAFLFFSNQANFPVQFLVFFYLTICFGLFISRLMGTAFIGSLEQNYDVRKAVAILGMDEGGIRLGAYLLKQTSLNFVGFLDQGLSAGNKKSPSKISSTNERLKAAAASGIEEVFVSVDASKMNNLSTLLKEGEDNCIRLKFVPDLSVLEASFKFDKMGEFTVLSSRKEPLENIGNRFKKRAFDIIVSLSAIVLVFSWLYPLLALIVKLQSAGPVFFTQLRTGRNNKPFWCFKFRSMSVKSNDDPSGTGQAANHTTPIGRFMRKTSLDELPQLFNVLLGYMSIIGPRPHMLAHTDEYSKIIDKYMVRQFLKPGISGWAQVNGFRGEITETNLMEKRVEYDIWYMENWSVMLDIKIMFLTIINLVKGEENAY